jgi:hypothetical protein
VILKAKDVGIVQAAEYPDLLLEACAPRGIAVLLRAHDF